ncbi:MAG TPA: outer membrane beta-barrel protein, partial [Chitinophagaceae bacterium]|nr:outer membrane beta-barrel protein [Chitinophagaceae bacterium]
DLTFVKFQKIKGIGITFGLIGGYNINSKWSIETGVLLNTKKYYTKGKYFDKSNIPDFSNVSFLSVSGICNMIEIPINVRYRFASNKNNHNWTATLGTSSYLMTKEYYDYSAIVNGENQQGEFTHYPSSKHLFAVINLGAGYERKISNGFSLRAEPYFKVPVSGIGTGNLHMSSTGITLGITKSFH